MRIDCHNHFYTKGYLKALGKRVNPPKIVSEGAGQLKLLLEGYTEILSDEFYHPERRVKDMSRLGVDMQVLSPGNPWVDIFKPEESISMARSVNDEISKIVENEPDKFVGIATLPFKSPVEAVMELERAVNQLGLRGFISASNIRGKPLSSPEFLPIFKKAGQLDAPVFIHPTTPACYETMEDYSLVTLLGYVFDTTISICKLIFSGVFEKVPKLKIVAAHLGGTLPYVAGRVDIGWRIPECKVNIRKLPSEYIKQIYSDTVAYDKLTLRHGYEFFGQEKLLYGSDYPFTLGDVIGNAQIIDELDVGQEEKDNIFHGNARTLLRI